MLQPIQSILFATDLTENCQAAYDFTLALATQFKATIYLLHVIEPLPENLDGRLKTLLGKHQWEDMVHSQQTNVRRSLLGKKSTNVVVREALTKFCNNSGIDESECDFQSREIIISDGDVEEEILKHARENECDLIVLGAHKTVFSKTSVGSKTKNVLKQAGVPVTVVPPRD
ncbi:universal stress protein A [Desulfomarina profundi]|uniref:Universal stress protein A n=1 Tax=Desulfomarina profundi TaxID=2772557 RepID=A0A8D5FRW8_9BACT|nr:universal stress protein [Desulfomarina profundi]BCL63224.1 universal stress protein A [Desulfomarina profundi]